MTFEVRVSAAAFDDVERLFEHLVDRAQTAEDLALAHRARDAILDTLQDLSSSPFIYRKAGLSPFLRELLIPFGRGGIEAATAMIAFLAPRRARRRWNWACK